MRFTFEGSEYFIEFQRESKLAGFHQQPRVYTTARILRVTGPGKKDTQVVRTATVGYNPEDRFSYDAGRRCALLLAMYDAPTKGGGAPLLGTPLTKKFRTEIWNAYFAR